MTNLIALCGFIGSGKDAVGKIILLLTHSYNKWDKLPDENVTTQEIVNYLTNRDTSVIQRIDKYGGWKIKKFAEPLKRIASILTGIPVEDFEKQEIKNSYLPECWDKWLGFVQGENHWEKITIRRFLQELGTDAIRNNLHPDSWINAAFANYKPEYIPTVVATYEQPDIADGYLKFPKWIFTDTRFPNECEAIKNRGGVVIRIVRDDDNYTESKHESETALMNWKYDYVLSNNGSLDELVENTKQMLQYFKIID